MRPSEDCLALIKKFEGCKLSAYLCPAGRWTIGWGHTGPDVRAGMKWTQEEVDKALRDDVDKHWAAISGLLQGSTQAQIDALTDFAFNLGPNALKKSTLLAKHRAGDYKGAAEEFKKWVYARSGGKSVKLPGLVARRAAEAQLYMKG
jgi:lysozyme